jgi:hypothetical protein
MIAQNVWQRICSDVVAGGLKKPKVIADKEFKHHESGIERVRRTSTRGSMLEVSKFG